MPRIQDVYSGSRIKKDQQQTIEVFFAHKKFTLSFRKYDPGCLFRILDPRSRIQESEKHWIPDPDPQHWIKLENIFFNVWAYWQRIKVFLSQKNFAKLSEIWVPGAKNAPDPGPATLQCRERKEKTKKKHHLHDVEEVVVDLGLVAELELDLVQVGERVLHLQPLEGGVPTPASTTSAWDRR